ncbi:MAG: substrate-binding domain-containing protein [Lachnospiraceae bacterium]|uniref:substrate-binding domain-containing protein n=1 Tax=Parablautia sp. Marseille-Q6255 TaxID=3039593 RepID=UPI0024BCEE42|nr:substrate-binding domain-containing protein [Parablautia sp. Marseille-Q6255]
MKKRVLAVLMSMAMLSGLGTMAVQAEEAPEKKAEDIKIAVVLHAMNSSFYTKLADGAKAAGEDLGITVDVTSPTTASNLAEQVSLLESCITADYDGIATVTWDPSGFNSVIAKAEEAGIPVVGFNMDAADCGTKAFIGQDYEDAGYELGKYMFGEVMNGTGKYIVASCGPADTALIARTEGIARAAEEYPDIEFVEVIDIGTDLTNAYGVIENAYLANPDVDAILGVDVFSEAIGTFIAAYDLQDEVKAAGFDLTEGTLKHVANGDMQLTVGQNPYMQGYYSVLELYMNLAHGCDFIDLNTGAQLVTGENVAEVEPE